MEDYKNRKYLSSTEVAKYLGVTVEDIHLLVKKEKINCTISTSGQQRFDIKDIKKVKNYSPSIKKNNKKQKLQKKHVLKIDNTIQTIFIKSAMKMEEIDDETVHLMVTSPPYYNAKLYSNKPDKDDLGDIHDIDEWFDRISLVWKEVYRVLSPGRKAFINIMNLLVREKSSFRTLNLAGRTIDVMEKIGFIFKRDIIWHKTNGVKAHFGTYPYPGGILLNNMHEFILEFNKPEKKGFTKYGHLTKEQKEASKIDKEFWLSLKNSDVWLMKPEKSGDGRIHVAPFPYELPYRLIKAYSYISETVLDPFMGSGTCLKAAIELSRNGIGYEIVPEIADVAIKNIDLFSHKYEGESL